MLINFYPISFFISLVFLAIVLIILYLKGSNLYQIFFSAVFGLYLIAAISVAVFPFVINNHVPDFRSSVNLIPFNLGTCFDYMPQKCVKGIFNNILLTIPFGFGIHFVARIKLRQVLCLTLLIGCSFEFTQLIMMLMFHVGLRSIDINDIILNTTGAFIGYGLYKLFGVIYYLIIQRFNLQPKHIFAYIGEIMALQHNS